MKASNNNNDELILEKKFIAQSIDPIAKEGTEISGYASIFGQKDQSGDVVQKGAFLESLERQKSRGNKIKMLWQHDPTQPIGVWDEVFEDEFGLKVKGRILEELALGREVMSLLRANVIDGLSIGYKPITAARDKAGNRLLTSVELWEISLVTFPMLLDARLSLDEQKSQSIDKKEIHALKMLRNELRELRNMIEKTM